MIHERKFQITLAKTMPFSRRMRSSLNPNQHNESEYQLSTSGVNTSKKDSQKNLKLGGHREST